MNSTTFGHLLEKLLYLSNQKKGTLSKELGYDISYISKWINTKNLPSQKNISQICKKTAKFIVTSLNEKLRGDFLDYFELNSEMDDEDLTKYIERILRESYISTAEIKNMNIYKGTHSEEICNGIIHVNPSLRKQYLSNDAELFLKKNEKMDMIISANLYHINNDDKKAISTMKNSLYEVENNEKIRVNFLMGLDGAKDDIIYNTILIINMAVTHPNIDLEIYNCEVDPNAVISVIKDNIFHSAIFTKDKKCLFTNMSKDASTVEHMYYSLNDMLKNQAKKIFEKIEPSQIIKDQSYVQYIMGSDLRWIIGSMNELLMPEDLFMEIGRQVFGEDPKLLKELEKINLFLQNVTYRSGLKALIYESELKNYISTGIINFFNIPIKLDFKQRERHIEYIEYILKNREKVEIRLVEDHFVEEFADSKNPSLYLSKTRKLTTVNPEGEINDYLIIRDKQFEDICDELFDIMWNDRKDVVIDDREYVLEKISKSRIYAKLINERFNK